VRPNLPCEDFPGLHNELSQLQAAYALYDDVDFDGLPEAASFALIEAASCGDVSDAFDEAITNAYLVNRAGAHSELEVYQTGEWSPYIGALATLRMLSSSMGIYLDQAFAPFDVAMHDYYVAVTCTDTGCEPANARGALPAEEPFAGPGDSDNDGFTNAEEWANVLAWGGSTADFANVALDPTNDGTTPPPSTGGGGGNGGACFIATAAYGTPLAAQLDTLRALRDRALLTNPPGAAFADLYYRLSPPAAQFIAERPALRAGVRAVITPLVSTSLLLVAASTAFVLGLFAWSRSRR
jgi:hypothetical protein